MCTSVLLAKKTSMLDICNSALVLLIDISTLEPMLLFCMSASVTSDLFDEDTPVLFLRFGKTDAP